MINGFLQILIVINPRSGSGIKKDWPLLLQQYFNALPYTTQFCILDNNGPENIVSNAITAFSPQLVIVVGGDGTISMVAQLLAGKGIALGIIPAGSANGMAKELNIPLTLNEALDICLNGFMQPCDMIEINSRHKCLHLSDIGLNAQLIKNFEEDNIRGKWGYAKVVLKTLWRKKQMNVVFTMRNTTIKRKAFMVVLANASKYGTGVQINPTGELNDGIFEIVIIRKLSVIELIKMLFHSGHFNPDNIESFAATHISITTKRFVHFQIDGEYMGKVKSLTARILPEKIVMMLPAKQ